MQLQHCIKGFLRSSVFLPTGRFCSIDHEEERRGFSNLCGEGPDPQHQGIGSSVALVGCTLHDWGKKRVEVVGVKGSVPIPDGSEGSQLYPIVHLPGSPNPHHQCHRGGSLSQPITYQPTFQVLGVSLPTTLGLPRHQMHLPITLAWTSSPLRYLSRAKATSEAEGIPEAESGWSPDST